MVNKREKAVAEAYESQGWAPLRGGAPDWLMVQVEGGEIVDYEFVEVKAPDGSLRYEQSIYKRVLEDLGATVRVEVVE